MKSAAHYLTSHHNRLMAALGTSQDTSRVADDLLTHMIRLNETKGIPFEDMAIRDVFVDDAGELHIHLSW